MLDEIFKYAPLSGAFVSPLSEKSIVQSLTASGGELGMKVAFISFLVQPLSPRLPHQETVTTDIEPTSKLPH